MPYVKGFPTTSSNHTLIKVVGSDSDEDRLVAIGLFSAAQGLYQRCMTSQDGKPSRSGPAVQYRTHYMVDVGKRQESLRSFFKFGYLITRMPCHIKLGKLDRRVNLASVCNGPDDSFLRAGHSLYGKINSASYGSISSIAGVKHSFTGDFMEYSPEDDPIHKSGKQYDLVLVDPALDENTITNNYGGVAFVNKHRSTLAGLNGDYVVSMFLLRWLPVWRPDVVAIKLRAHNDLVYLFMLITRTSRLGYSIAGIAHNDLDNKLEFFVILSKVKTEASYSLARCLIQGVHCWFTSTSSPYYFDENRHVMWLSSYDLRGFLSSNFGQARVDSQPDRSGVVVHINMRDVIPAVSNRDAAFRD